MPVILHGHGGWVRSLQEPGNLVRERGVSVVPVSLDGKALCISDKLPRIERLGLGSGGFPDLNSAGCVAFATRAMDRLATVGLSQ
jgi:hypothetical protein